MDGNIHIATQAELLEKAIKATATFLRRNGDEVLDMAFECPPGRIDLVSRDAGGTIHIVNVRVRRYSLPDMLEVDADIRHVLELRAACWLESHREEVDCAVEFDFADLAIVGEDRALMRVHRNVLAGAPILGGELLARSEIRAAAVPDDAVEVDVDDADSSSEEDSDE